MTSTEWADVIASFMGGVLLFLLPIFALFVCGIAIFGILSWFALKRKK